MSEAVEVIISADDQASKKFAQVAANAEKELGRVKDVGKNLKGASAFGSVIANMLGGTEIGGAFNKVGELTEKVNQFGEVSKMGRAGALAFKAGLVGLAAVAGFQLGQALGNLIFDTAKFERQLEKAREKAKALDAELRNMASARMSRDVADLELIRDPEKKTAAIERMFGIVEKNIAGTESKIKASEKSVDAWAAAWKITGERKGEEQRVKDQLESEKQMLETYKQQRQQLQQLKDDRERAAKVAAIQDAEKLAQQFDTMLTGLNEQTIALTQGESAAERYRLKTMGMSDAMISWIVGTREANDALKAAQAEQEKAAQSAQKASDAFSSAAVNIQKQRIELEEGVEAARKFELVQQGMSDAMAERVAEEEAMNEARKKQAQEEKDLIKKEEDERANLKKMVEEETEALRLKRIELEKGVDAAERERLLKRGVDAADVDRIVAEKKALRELEEKLRKEQQEKDKTKQDAGKNNEFGTAAKESRLLSRGTENQLAISKEQLATLNRMLDFMRQDAKGGRLKLKPVVNS